MPSPPAPPSTSTSASATRVDERLLVATGAGLRIGDGPIATLAGRRVTAVTAAPPGEAADDGVVWALVDGSELVRLDAGGTESVAKLESGRGMCVHVHRDLVLVGGADAGLWRLDGDRLVPVTAFRAAPTSESWYTPWGGPPAVFSMASHGDDLYVSVHVGGILRSADGGHTWAATIDLHDDVHQVTVDPDGTVWAATGMSGLAESTDRGRTWRYHTDGLHGTYLLAVAVTDAGVLVGASSGHAADDGAVYLYEHGRFERVEGLPDPLGGAVGPRQMAGRGALAGLVTPDGTLHHSTDGGRRWHRVGGALPSPTAVHLAPTAVEVEVEDETEAGTGS